MKLVRMADGKIGLFVLLPKGAYAIDIASSLGVFSHDPLSNGLLNGVLKDGHHWSLLVNHWAHLRSPLKRLQNIALRSPDHPSLVLQPHERPARRQCRRSDHRHRNYGHRDLRGARSDGSARNGAAVHAASGEQFATRLDGDRNCAGDRLLFY
jgi:hypothetical protein